MAERTPGPWYYVPSTEHHGPYITSDFGGTIADLYLMSKPGTPSVLNGGSSKPVPFFHEMADPNAAFIVKACNAHEALVEALGDLVNACIRYDDEPDSTVAVATYQSAVAAAALALTSAQRGGE